MRQMEFTMSRPNLVKPGDEVDITEGNLMNNCDYSELSKITIKCRIKIMLFTYIFYKYMRKA